ncbi:MAG: class I SAM-dependent methyltransferase [Candidatus Undinarchaeales archaeon]|jgi:ubiquinone/menaquinone biosynthesis C-methylase UbiE|nr:class I SAM-dependent methyltransferase [Candidatus Undinarchaeales archaeon]MDP7493505.1 class I SAM-dependent methyltransferase [Candidatus Undinarchaeales archaeon]
MDEMEMLFEVFTGLPRAGPGDDESTRRAYRMMKGRSDNPAVLDIGCGPGKQTIELARISNGTVTALDIHQPFLDQLMAKAKDLGVADRVRTVNRSMTDMNFDPGTFDVVWSEGALYLMGFINGLKACRMLLRPGGYIAATEIVWLRDDPPNKLRAFWDAEYPDIRTIDANLKLIAGLELEVVGHFVLPQSAWTENLYAPLMERVPVLEKKYEGNPDAQGFLRTLRDEVTMYERYKDYYGYCFFVLRGTDL